MKPAERETLKRYCMKIGAYVTREYVYKARKYDKICVIYRMQRRHFDKDLNYWEEFERFYMREK